MAQLPTHLTKHGLCGVGGILVARTATLLLHTKTASPTVPLVSFTLTTLQAAAAPSLPVVLAKMTLFILTETSAGYALLKAKDKKLLTRDTLVADTENAEDICSL